MRTAGAPWLLRFVLLHAAAWWAACSELELKVRDSGNAANDDSLGGFALGGRVLPPGIHVRVHGLRTAVALNGQEGSVLAFDRSSGRYLVQMAGRGPSMKIRPENLELLARRRARQSRARYPRAQGRLPRVSGGIAHPGSLVVMTGLVHVKPLNGEIGTVGSFDFKTKRYVVQLREGSPIRVRPGNLLLLADSAGRRLSPSSIRQFQQQVSACQALGRSAPAESRHFVAGEPVELADAGEPAAGGPARRGLRGVVLCFDARVGQYMVALPNAAPRWLPAEQLWATDGAQQAAGELAGPLAVDGAAADGGASEPATRALPEAEGVRPHRRGRRRGGSGASRTWRVGSYVRLRGLRRAAAQLNGKIALVRSFDRAARRYVVRLPGGELKRVRAAHLGALQASSDKLPRSDAEAETTPPALTVCNAYASAAPLQVFASSEGRVRGGRPRQRLGRRLAFRDCADVRDLPQTVTSLIFTAGDLEVAHLPLNATQTQGGLEVTVFRSSPDSKKALVDSRAAEPDVAGGSRLSLVNAYTGSRSLKLSMRQGSSARELPVEGSIQLSEEGAVELSLTDGLGHLRLSFQPRRKRSYCIVASGLDGGLEDEARGVGLMAHEVGSWTVSEDLDGSGGPAEEALADGEASEAGRSTSEGGAGAAAALAEPQGAAFAQLSSLVRQLWKP